MGMDALKVAAIDSLSKQILPKLLQSLDGLRKNPAQAINLSEDLLALLGESHDLIGMILGKASSEELAGAENFEGMTSDDSSAMEMGDGELSDDAAMALLAQMDGADEITSASNADPKVAAASVNSEMDDDAAMALLEQMDAPLETAAPTSSDDMSDEDAMALLAEMDEPTSPAPASASAEEPSAEDEALALLAQFGADGDGAMLEQSAPMPGTAAAPAVVVSTPSPVAGAVSVPDEATIGEVPEFSDNDFSSDPEMMKDFLQNCDELMETLDETILELERSPDNKETIEAIFRAAHTLKGAAGMFGFKAIERVMHRMENLFDLIRRGKMSPGADLIDVVFQGLDVLKSLLDGVRNGTPSGVKTAPVVRNLELAALGQSIERRGARGGGQAPAESAAPSAAAVTSSAPKDKTAGNPDAAKKQQQASTIRVDLERLDHLVNLVGELVIDRTRFVSIEEALRNMRPQLNLAGNMSETVQLFGRHMNEIQEIIMKVRMVPIGNAFNKFPRIVRDLARSLNKEIELFIDGETTELDKTLVEQIGDPLVHLIRNSCDHGVEDPATREAAGKQSLGRVYLSARQEGNAIVITIEDDGKGMCPERIRKKAVEKGLITEEDMLSQRDIFNLIFEPGFSTAEAVTEVSGRGVGMDVVKKQISKLKGLVDIDSEVGRGTIITIQLPLTLAIVQSLLVEADGETFAIPISSIVESRRIEPEEIQRVGDAEVIKLRDNVLPLLHLNDTLHLQRKKDICWYDTKKPANLRHSKKRKDRHFVVIVGSAERRFGIIVDSLLNQQEMVIKSMGPLMREIPCVAGGSVLGNGEVVLVLDIQELENVFRNRSRVNQNAA